jgi:ACS family glucarate transporter-like MFS transporter
MVCGIACDYLVGKGLAGSSSRAWFGGLGMLFCCIGLSLAAISGSKWATLLWLTLALGSLGLTTNSAWTTCSDIGGKYAGSVSAWMNFVGNIVGGAAPMITAWVVTHYGWRAAILVTAATGVIGAGFWIFVRPDVPLKHRYSKEATTALAHS